MRAIYRLLSILGDLRAARRGPGTLASRQGRKVAHRGLARILQRFLCP